MTDLAPDAAKPALQNTRKWSMVWVVPILAVLIGSGLLYKNISSKGAEIIVHFETADGIEAGKTEVKCRSVTVGKVSKVELAEDLKGVNVYCVMGAGYDKLLKKNSSFWVVRPRVSSADISGLGTLLTGVYLELDLGNAKKTSKIFYGLEDPPATSRSVPGRRLTLVSDDAGSMKVGAAIYYRGFEVGRIESCELDQDGRRITHEAFIREEYQDLVRVNTKFWQTSGIDVEAGVDGFRIRTPSFQAMISGGVSFAVPEGVPPAEPIQDDAIFTLHEDKDTAESSTFEPTLRILLLFDQSVRGLSKDAPVEYRGIMIGRVTNISFDYVPEIDNQKVPVLVEVDPSLLRASAVVNNKEQELTRLAEAVSKGLRATLKTGSLLTGALYVNFDYYPDEPNAALSSQGKYPVVPTLSSGFAQFEVKLVSILDKIEKLKIEDTLEKIGKAAEATKTTITNANTAVSEIEKTATAAREVMEDPNFRSLPSDVKNSLSALEQSLNSYGPKGVIQGDFLRTMDEFRSAMRSMESLSDTIKEKPNSLLFGKDGSRNPRPRAAGRKR